MKLYLFCRPKMAWTYEHDIMLCRKILVEEPFRYKAGTREKGQVWDKIANNLNKNCTGLRFSVNQRGVRDRFAVIERAYKRKMAAEERESGTNPESTEVDQAVESIIERSEGAQIEIEKVDEGKKRQAEKEKETAEIIRKRSMDRLAETRDRELGEGVRKKRRIGIETGHMELFKEKSEREFSYRGDKVKLKREELELRERELMLKEREQGEREKRDERLLAMIMEQQNCQKALLLQLQQQNQAILSLFEQLKK